jgi:outer membrane protein OmpA-like peptidoglycan-associated protein/tetratricopeptide (TPR) repeat protein
MKRLLLLCFLAASIVTAGYAQDIKKNQKAASKLAKEGFKELDEDSPDFEAALKMFVDATKLDGRNATYHFYAAVCQINMLNKQGTADHLKRAVAINANLKEAHYLLGVMAQLEYKFSDAVKHYESYKEKLSGEELERTDILRLISRFYTGERSVDLAEYIRIIGLEKIIAKRIEECNHGQKLIDNPVEAIVTNLGKTVNTIYPDYVPVITADESQIFFTSRNPTTTGGEIEHYDGLPFEDVYFSIHKEGKWSAPENMGRPINTKTHDAIAGLSANGLTLYLYKDDNAGDLYECKKRGTDWSRPRPMKEINSSWADKSVTISADEQLLFFTSNRKGGIGGYDIYMSTREGDDKWSAPVNMGPAVNTEYDEEGVFFHPDGRTLYFSSKGHSSMGGYDVFKTILQADSTWSKPENLGYPINTTGDDIFFVLSASGLHGYYSSHRKGGVGKSDLYRISMPVAMRIKKNEEDSVAAPVNPLTLVTGIITDDEKNIVVANLYSDGSSGKYLVALPSGRNYGITVKKEGYLFHSENFDIKASEDYHEVQKDIALKKIAVGSKIVLRNIFFDFDSPSLTDASIGELKRLVKLLNDVPTLKIEISGHTDNKGSDAYNKKLSGERAASVVTYLVKNGIDASRLRSAGYGEERPMADNANPDGSDNPEGRQLNRRVEFEILEN